MMLDPIESFTLELDRPDDVAYTGGEVVSGQVVLELCRDTRVHAMKLLGHGLATAHWVENICMNSVYYDYTSKIGYFKERQHLIRGTCNHQSSSALPVSSLLPPHPGCMFIMLRSHSVWKYGRCEKSYT
ncbi:unnamed protein product [Pleuronectes platessa]|uniref:Arrestin-like N-terminal domain-containing protein n=1 Tax=Pleuronectes platessa TaxID=8262 RepID=A0A9N7TX70_PLEPL|nr:unnamed protein product [Pleuronectes platessa]